MKYIFMIVVAGILALFSSGMTALGMANLFAASGMFILALFIVIDLGRFILFNFVVDEWQNLRKIKYVIVIILSLLFLYSAVGIYAKLDSLVSPSTRQAMTDAAYYNKSEQNAAINENRTEDSLQIAKQEYNAAIEWNNKDYENCLLRAQKAADIAEAENKCNNTKRKLDQKASAALKAAQNESKQALVNSEQTIQQNSKNKTEIASILTTICKFSGKPCTTYDDLQSALTIVIILVIIGTDYLQIAIILAVNTRKNKKRLNTDINSSPEINPSLKQNLSTLEKDKEILKNLNLSKEQDFYIKANPVHITLTDDISKKPEQKQKKKSFFKPIPFNKYFLFTGAKPKK